MPKTRNPKVEQAKTLFLEGIELIEIANRLDVPAGTVRSWKNRYKWECNATQKKNATLQKKKGGQPGNTNAVGNGAPLRNTNAEKYGFFRKYLPEETVSIIEEMPENPLDILWDQIQIAYAAIIRAQKIMYVKDRDDMTTTQIEKGVGKSSLNEKWEVQQAWDKQSNFLQAQARAQKTLEGMINRYEDLLHKNWDTSTEEQKTRIALLKAKKDKLTGDNSEVEDMDGIEGDIYGND